MNSRRLLMSFLFILITNCSSHLVKPRQEQLNPGTLKHPFYLGIESRILRIKGFDREVIGSVHSNGQTYSIYLLSTPRGKPGKPDLRKNVLLSAGLHGDEPAGTFALLEFMENEAASYNRVYRFFIFPALNPTGLNANTLENTRHENINRRFFNGSRTPEATFVIKTLLKLKLRFLVTMDLHEIPPYWADEGFKAEDNPRAAYLYETQIDPTKRIGPKLISVLPKEIEICQWPIIYGDKAHRGVISYPEANFNLVYAQGTTLDAYLFGRYTNHSFTTETPIGWPLEKRIQTHLIWLRTALANLANVKTF